LGRSRSESSIIEAIISSGFCFFIFCHLNALGLLLGTVYNAKNHSKPTRWVSQANLPQLADHGHRYRDRWVTLPEKVERGKLMGRGIAEAARSWAVVE
jgi:hypothetical protein